MGKQVNESRIKWTLHIRKRRSIKEGRIHSGLKPSHWRSVRLTICSHICKSVPCDNSRQNGLLAENICGPSPRWLWSHVGRPTEYRKEFLFLSAGASLRRFPRPTLRGAKRLYSSGLCYGVQGEIGAFPLIVPREPAIYLPYRLTTRDRLSRFDWGTRTWTGMRIWEN